MGMNLFARIFKVDEARREVWGRAAEEVIDKSEEIMDYAKSKPHFVQWSQEFSDATNGKSLGNIRAMHGKVAAGKAIAFNANDADKAFDIGTKIVDQNEWEKVLEGVYTGFSIGGSYVGSPEVVKMDGRDVKRYVAKPTEISLVDNPCIPTAKFFDIIKADGTVLQKLFKDTASTSDGAGGGGPAVDGNPAPAAVDGDPLDVPGTADEVFELARVTKENGYNLGTVIGLIRTEGMHETIESVGKREFSTEERKKAAKEGAALPDGSFPIKTVGDLKNAVQALGRAKDKAKAKAHIIARAKALGATKELPDAWTKVADGEVQKGMWNVAGFAQMLEQCADVCASAQYDADAEGDDSPIPMQLRNWLGDGIEIFKGMADEEATEMLASLKTAAGVGEFDDIHEAIEAAVAAGTLTKRASDPEISVVDLVKLADTELTEDERKPLKSLDDIRKAIVAKAAGKMSAANMDRLQAAHDHLASMGAKCGEPDADDKAAPAPVQKDAPTDVSKQLTEALDRIKKLEAQPMPSVVTLRMAKAVSKEEDQAKNTPKVVDPDTVELLPTDPLVKNADGTVDYFTSRVMKARRLEAQARASASK